MRCIVNNNINPSFNLAFEEELFLSEIVSESPTFCLWRNQKSVIVGVSQVVENEVNLHFCNDNGIPIVRRHTGGGAVYHDLDNLNYSFFFPHKPEGNPYAHVFSILRPAFRHLGIDMGISTTNDLLLDGKKFSGMAMRTMGERMLVHGTLLFDTDMDAMAKALTTEKGKFNRPRGVASRHAEVINIKSHLNGIDDVSQLAEALGKFLSDEKYSDCVTLPEGFIDKVMERAAADYTPLNKKEIVQ